METPKEITIPNIDYLKQACQDYIEYLNSDDYHEHGLSDYEHDIFERAMTCFYGESVWDFINNRIE